MIVGSQLQFDCLRCSSPVYFSIFECAQFDGVVRCERCQKKYLFEDKSILQDLRQFEALCRQVYASKNILAKTNVAIDVGSHHVKVPYKILLTRFTSVLDLEIGNQKLEISFRSEPLKEIPLTSFSEIQG